MRGFALARSASAAEWGSHAWDQAVEIGARCECGPALGREGHGWRLTVETRRRKGCLFLDRGTLERLVGELT